MVVSESTLVRDVETALGFLVQLRRGRKSISQATVTDVDAFVRNACHPSLQTNRRGYLQFAPSVSPISGGDGKSAD